MPFSRHKMVYLEPQTKWTTSRQRTGHSGMFWWMTFKQVFFSIDKKGPVRFKILGLLLFLCPYLPNGCLDEVRKKMAINALEYSRGFSWDKTAHEFMNYIHKCVWEKPGDILKICILLDISIGGGVGRFALEEVKWLRRLRSVRISWELTDR